MNNNTQYNLMNVVETAAYLGIKVSRLRYAIMKKQIPYIKIGRLLRFERSILNEWLATLRQFPKKMPFQLVKEFSSLKFS